MNKTLLIIIAILVPLAAILGFKLLDAKEQLNELTANTNCTKCDTVTYCGMDTSDLKRYIINYRDSVWRKISNYGGPMDAMYNPAPLESPYSEDALDARYTDMNIDELESYLCKIRHSKNCDKVNIIRFFYIRYDNKYEKVEYRQKHSLALVPVYKDEAGNDYEITNVESGENFIYSNSRCTPAVMSNIANHNSICPPPKGCNPDGNRTILWDVDTH